MKTTLTLLCALFCAAEAMAAQPETAGDTLILNNVKKLRIETRDTVQRIVISGTQSDPFYHYTQRITIPDTSAVRRKATSVKDMNKVATKKKDGGSKRVTLMPFLNIGLSTVTGAPTGYDFKLWPSFEIGAGVTFDWRPFGKRNIWSAGLAYNVRTLRSSSESYWTKDTETQPTTIALTPYAADQSNTHTLLRVHSLQVPLLYTHAFTDDGRWRLSVGALLSLNLNAYAKRGYTQAGEDYDVFTRDIHQRKLTIEPTVLLKVPHVPTLYCRYSPMTFFQKDRGPEFHLLSFGLHF